MDKDLILWVIPRLAHWGPQKRPLCCSGRITEQPQHACVSSSSSWVVGQASLFRLHMTVYSFRTASIASSLKVMNNWFFRKSGWDMFEKEVGELVFLKIMIWIKFFNFCRRFLPRKFPRNFEWFPNKKLKTTVQDTTLIISITVIVILVSWTKKILRKIPRKFLNNYIVIFWKT
jgi:hypothetical protein